MLDEKDYLTFQLYTASKSPQVKRMRLMSWGLTTFVFLCCAFLFYSSANQFLAVYFLVCTVLAAIFYPFYSRWRYKRHYLKHVQNTYKNKFGTSTQLTFTQDAIINKDLNGEFKFNTNEIEAIHEIKDYYFIKSKGGLSLIISKLKTPDIHYIKESIDRLIKEKNIPLNVDFNWKWR